MVFPRALLLSEQIRLMKGEATTTTGSWSLIGWE